MFPLSPRVRTGTNGIPVFISGMDGLRYRVFLLSKASIQYYVGSTSYPG